MLDAGMLDVVMDQKLSRTTTKIATTRAVVTARVIKGFCSMRHGCLAGGTTALWMQSAAAAGSDTAEAPVQIGEPPGRPGTSIGTRPDPDLRRPGQHIGRGQRCHVVTIIEPNRPVAT